MKKQEIVDILSAHRQEMANRFAVQSLSLFGSIVRDEAGPDSDVDILVEFPHPPTFDQYMGLKFYLEDLLGTNVDLVTSRSLKKRVLPHVMAEAVRVA